MNKQAADRLATKVRQAGDRTATAVYDARSGEWITQTSSGTCRSPFDFYYTIARLKKTARSMQATLSRLQKRETEFTYRRIRKERKIRKALRHVA